MARRKARWRPSTPPGTFDEKTQHVPRLWQTASHANTSRLSHKKGVARAQAKHRHDNLTSPPPPPPPPTLADRFYALPPELRAHIFALLIVQPVKWDISHKLDCPLRQRTFDLTPRITYATYLAPSTCVACCRFSHHAPRWRQQVNDGLQIWTNPWRSQWAPEQRNPYLCTSCYDEMHRERPFPEARSLPCLCARRQNLQVLLVCRKWYDEATHVFYTRNTFAFEDPATFIMFVRSLPPRPRQTISKVSLMALCPFSPGDAYVDWGYPHDHQFQLNPKIWAPAWSLLRSLPSLSTLEMDSRLLKNERTVHALLRLGLRNLRRIRFVERPRHTNGLNELWRDGTEKIWPSVACRSLILGGFADEVGQAVKGRRRKLLKGKEGQEVIHLAVKYCLHPRPGILESGPFEQLGFSVTETRSLRNEKEEDYGYDDDHFQWLGLDAT